LFYFSVVLLVTSKLNYIIRIARITFIRKNSDAWNCKTRSSMRCFVSLNISLRHWT